MFLHDPNQFCEVRVCSGRLEGFESITINETMIDLLTKVGLELAARAAKKDCVVDQDVPFRVHSYLFTKHPLCL